MHHCNICVYLLQKNQSEARFREDSLHQGHGAESQFQICVIEWVIEKGNSTLIDKLCPGCFKGIILKCSGDKTSPTVINGISVT